ncbi:hypothetical protein MRX96_010315 [Rhipicephalus microplus]
MVTLAAFLLSYRQGTRTLRSWKARRRSSRRFRSMVLCSLRLTLGGQLGQRVVAAPNRARRRAETSAVGVVVAPGPLRMSQQGAVKLMLGRLVVVLAGTLSLATHWRRGVGGDVRGPGTATSSPGRLVVQGLVRGRNDAAAGRDAGGNRSHRGRPGLAPDAGAPDRGGTVGRKRENGGSVAVPLVALSGDGNAANLSGGPFHARLAVQKGGLGCAAALAFTSLPLNVLLVWFALRCRNHAEMAGPVSDVTNRRQEGDAMEHGNETLCRRPGTQMPHALVLSRITPDVPKPPSSTADDTRQKETY